MTNLPMPITATVTVAWNGAAVPASAPLLGSNGSGQFIAVAPYGAADLWHT